MSEDISGFKAFFGGQGTYQGLSMPQPVPVWIHVEDLDSPARPGPGLTMHFGQGVAMFAEGRLDASELSGLGIAPCSLDQCTDADGLAWVVERAWREGGMWAAHLTSSNMLLGINIQSKTTARSAVGSAGAAWADAATVQGFCWALSGEERASMGSLQAASTHRARIPAWPGLTTQHRLRIGIRTFDITFVDDVCEQGRIMVIDCLETIGKAAG